MVYKIEVEVTEAHRHGNLDLCFHYLVLILQIVDYKRAPGLQQLNM